MAKKIKYGQALYIRVTDELKKKIKHEARKKHQGVTDYLRSILTKSVNLESLKSEKKGKILKIKKHLYNPHLSNPFRLTSSRLELYQSCRQCFYLYLREGIRRPGFLIPTFSQTIDEKVRNEMDIYRIKQQIHPIFKENNLNLVPYDDKELVSKWRGDLKNIMGRKGLLYHDKKNNFLLTSFVDDIMKNKENEQLVVVDFRATIRKLHTNSPYHLSYNRRIEFNQWLLRKNGFAVDDIGYFLYYEVDREQEEFKDKIQFRKSLVGYEGQTYWIEPVLTDIKSILDSNTPPDPSPNCQYCNHSKKTSKIFNYA